MGASHDVQKYDPVAILEVLPGCVALHCLTCNSINNISIITIRYPAKLGLMSFLSSADDGEQVLVDVEGKDHKHISDHVRKILGKTE